MFSNNHKISNNQIKKMLVFDMISISILIVPGIAAAGAGRDGIIAILIGSAAALLYTLLLFYFTRQINGDFFTYSKKVTGKYISGIFAALYIVKIVFSCVFTLGLFAKIIGEALLPNMNYQFIMITLILTGVYAASKGIEVRARIAEILFFIVLVPVFLLFILGIGKVEISNLLPLFTTSAGAVGKTSYGILLTYSAAEVILFAIPMLTNDENKKRRKRYVVQAILITAALNIVLFVVVAGLLGPEGTGGKLWSFVTILQIIEIPGGFVQRQDALILTFWLMSIFTIISTYFYYLTKITNDIIPVKKKRYLLIFYGVLLFLLSIKQVNMETLFQYYGKYLSYIGLPQSILIPAIVILAGRSNKKGDDARYEAAQAQGEDIQ